MEPFKNLISAEVVRRLGELVSTAYPKFDAPRFEKSCLQILDTLELKQRALHIGEQLWLGLPGDPAQAFEILHRAIQPLPTLQEGDAFDGWMFMPLNALLSLHGTKAVPHALQLLPEITKRFTAEFGIRVFLIEERKSIMPLLHEWAADPDPHLRRLVSEGTRPRLPWAEQIPAFIEDPRPVLPLLELLKDDPSEYVRRSVANHLNDISKDHPELMLDVVEKWLSQPKPQRARLIRHACRSLVKQGHPRCLELLGFGAPKVQVAQFSCNPAAISLGDTLRLDLILASTSADPQALVIDYKFHLVKANGRTAPKVFKGSQLTLAPRSQKTVQKRFTLKPISTRKYYTGKQTVELLVNGKTLAAIPFHLSV